MRRELKKRRKRELLGSDGLVVGLMSTTIGTEEAQEKGGVPPRLAPAAQAAEAGGMGMGGRTGTAKGSQKDQGKGIFDLSSRHVSTSCAHTSLVSETCPGAQEQKEQQQQQQQQEEEEEEL